MSLLQEIQRLYDKADKKSKNKVKSKEDIIEREIAWITAELKKAAKKKHEMVRINYNFEDTVVDYFKNEGFIVWNNRHTLLIKIPQDEPVREIHDVVGNFVNVRY